MNSIKWKSSEILKVFGTTIREGTFTGGNVTDDGVISRGSPTTFTPSKIAKIFENIDTHVPLYLGHSTEPNRRPIGYAYKFGVTETLDDIKYNGFIFDKGAMNKIATEGWDRVSPEISGDDERLDAIAFVMNPAINGTDAGIEQIVFSQGDVNSNSMTETNTPDVSTSDVSTTNVPTQSTTQQTGSVPEHKSTPEPIKTETPVDVSALVKQVEDYKAKYEQATAKTEELHTQHFNNIVAEMKDLGIEKPDQIVKGLPVEQKISVLSKMKESIVTKTPLATPTESTTQNDRTTVDTALDEVLIELGVSKEEYSKITGKK
jgi:hypothetical protein